jgi:DNA processing protein
MMTDHFSGEFQLKGIDGWLRGNDLLLFSEARNFLSITGARSASESDKNYAFWLAKVLSDEFVIVSGFAEGVDQSAHAGTILNRGTTVAVMPCGIDNVFPLDSPGWLVDATREAGGFFSTFEPDEWVERKNFLHRNGTIASLADACIVVGARTQSGSSNFIRHAKKNGKTVFLAGSSDHFDDCHRLSFNIKKDVNFIKQTIGNEKLF